MITEDVAKLVVEIENSSKNGELQNELVQLQQKTGSLKDENKRLASAMEILRAQGKQNSDEFKQLKASYDANSTSITENEKRMKTLRQTMNNAGLSANDLRKKATDLQKELNGMTRAADPERFDRLNKELKETQQQLKQVRAGTNDTGNGIGNLMNMGKKLLPSFLGIAGVISLVRQLGSSFVETFKATQTTGDAWKAMMGGMKNTYDTFLRTIATGDWSNFLSNMREAYRVGKEVTQMLDELFERTNSFKIYDAHVKNEIEELFEIQKDVTKSNEERLTAGQKIIELTRKQADLQKDILKQELDAHQIKLDHVTKMSDEEKKYFIENYNQNITQIRQAGKLLEAEKEYRKAMLDVMKVDSRGNTYTDLIALEDAGKKGAIVDKLRESFSEYETAYNTLIKYNKGNDDLVKPYVDTLEKMINVTNESERSLRRIKTQNASLVKQITEEEKKQTEEAYKDEITAAETLNRELRKVEAEKYKQGEIDKEAFNANMLVLEDQLIRRKLAINIKYGKDTGALEDQLLSRTTKSVEDMAKMTEEQKKKLYESELKASENFYREERKKQADRYTQGEIDQVQYDDSIRSLEQLLLQEKLALNIKYGKDTTAIEDQLIAYQIKCYEDLQKKLAEISKKENKDKSDYEKQLESEAAAIIKELRGQSIRENMNFELAQLEKLHKAGLISEKQYEQKRLQIKLKGAEQYAQKAAQFAQLGADLVSALQDAEYSKLEAQKEKELALAGDDAEKRKQIEEEYEAKKLEVQKKYADVDMAAKIAQTIAAGALAVIQAWGQLGPIAGGIMAAVVAATTALQIQTIIQQRNAIKNMSPGGSGSSSASQRVVLPGREEGGYTTPLSSWRGDGGEVVEREQDGKLFCARRRKRRGYVEEPTVLTGEAGPEFVANNDALANPTIRPVLDIIDIAQRNGSISSINLPKLIKTAGYEKGGYTGTQGTSSTTVIASETKQLSTTDKAITAILTETRDLLRDLKSNGVKAPVVITELEKKQALLAKSRALGSRT